MPDRALCEVLDEAGRTLCLLDHREAKAQKLAHRAIAALLCARRGPYILRRTPAGFGFAHFAHLPAGLAGEDAAMAAMDSWPGLEDAVPLFWGRLAVCGAHTALYLLEISRLAALALAESDDWLFLQKAELAALAQKDFLEPFFRQALAAGFPAQTPPAAAF